MTNQSSFCSYKKNERKRLLWYNVCTADTPVEESEAGFPLPADCRGAESDSGRSPPPAQNHVIIAKPDYEFDILYKQVRTVASKP